MKINIDKKRKIIKQKLNKDTLRVKIPIIIDWINFWYFHYWDLDIWSERYYVENKKQKLYWIELEEVYEYIYSYEDCFLNELSCECE